MHYEIRFSGSGGQGMMLMGDITAEAAGNTEGREIVLTKSYGPESRGGACRSELIIDDGAINYPVMTAPDFVLAMTQQSCDKYSRDLKPDGILLVDTKFVGSIPRRDGPVYALPITETAEAACGSALPANVVALGIISVIGGCAASESMRDAVKKRFSGKLAAINEAAFEAGVKAGVKARADARMRG